jgi:hypothetical protein
MVKIEFWVLGAQNRVKWTSNRIREFYVHNNIYYKVLQ